jgi:hypothetical protein
LCPAAQGQPHKGPAPRRGTLAARHSNIFILSIYLITIINEQEI